MNGENLGAYLAMLGETVTLQPAAGGTPASARALVGIETDPMFAGMVHGDRPAALFSLADVVSLERGDLVTHNGQQYQLRTKPKRIEDGHFCLVDLELV